MARNGAGVYSLPAGSTVTNGDVSDASDVNTPFADLETDMNTPRPIVAGGTGASSASAARTALGLAIGTDVQAYDAGLASIAGLTTAADRMIYTTASDTYAVATLTAAGRAILDDADAAAQLVTLGAQASDATLTSLSGLSLVGGDLLYATAADTLARLPKGAVDQALYMNAGLTGPEWSTAYRCRAWVNFNGTGTIAIRASGNVSSITDNGVGNYTINFSTALPDTNYAISAFSRSDGSIAAIHGLSADSGDSKTTSAVQVRARFATGSSAGIYDSPEVGCVIFR